MNWYQRVKLSQPQVWSPIDDREIERSRSPQSGPSTIFPGNRVPKNYFTRLPNNQKWKPNPFAMLDKLLSRRRPDSVSISRRGTILEVTVRDKIKENVSSEIHNKANSKGIKQIVLRTENGDIIGRYTPKTLPDLKGFSPLSRDSIGQTQKKEYTRRSEEFGLGNMDWDEPIKRYH